MSKLRTIFSASLAAVAASRAADAPDAAQLAFFEKSIRPVLVEKCYQCHSADSEKVKGGLLLDTREGMRAGGDSGHAVVPGNVAESLLLKAMRHTDKDMAMPPEKSGGKLPDAVIADFEKWVKMGAPDPRDGGEKFVKKEIDFDEARKFWAFQPPRPATSPPVKDAAWPRTEIDRFILAGLEAKNLKPVADADPRVLIRRISFDLIGLPPTPEEVEAFVAESIRRGGGGDSGGTDDGRANPQSAIRNFADRLLSSPQFGERWGRHWLDVARFAESTGRERNFTFPEAWRYRDWVIAALNADQPYDQFIREQIAGDLLPAKDGAERDAHLIATGFLALGPKGLNEKNREQFRMDVIDEQIDTTSRAVLGLTVACARCHDHKFDPVPQKDYYALAGIFHSTDTFFGTGNAGGKIKNGTTLLSLAGSSAALSSASEPRKQLADFLAQNPAKAKKFKQLPPAKKARLLERFSGKDSEPQAPAPAAAAHAMGVLEGRPADTRLLVRGELDQPGERVARGFVTVLTGGPAPAIPTSASGRAELADWLVDKSNPLTARVAVNRVWAHLFGEGLVRTPDNFGATGETPSHPELLDALALKFMADGWSVKNLIRTIVLSRAYQIGSAWDGKNYEADPGNVLLWRASPRRLDAEAIRDAMLAASGTIDLKPPHGSVVANVGDGYIGKGIRPEAFDIDANYRSVYLPIVRDFVPDALGIFDFAEPSLVTASREVTNVPSQALYLMNNAFVIAQSQAMAKRILATPLDYPRRIDLAYRLTLSRLPTEAERARADRYLRAEAKGLIPVKSGSIPEASVASWATFCQALFACAEFRYLR